MPLTIKVSDDFLRLFKSVITGHKVNNNTVNLFVLNIRSNAFNYESLLQQLYDIIVTYALSNSRLSEYIGTFGGKAFVEAREKLRKHSSNEGELGEMLLYAFLESHLKAPKLLSKLEIKTSSNDYVKGSDGVHLLKIGDQDYQVIFGESKMVGDLQTGIYKAFASIKKFLEKQLTFETTLIDSQLIKESVTNDEYDLLKAILIPQKNTQEIETDYSFGVFLGYELKLCDEDKRLDNKAFRAKVSSICEEDVRGILTSIDNQIASKGLHGYTFYFYIVPFTDIENIRKDLIKRIQEA